MSFNGMEGPGEEMTADDVADGAYLRKKESDHSLKPNDCNLFASERSGWTDGSVQLFTDTLEGKAANRCINSMSISEAQCGSPCLNETGVICKELTLRNYKSPNLAVAGSSNSREAKKIGQGQWQHLYNLGSGMGNGSLDVDDVSRGKDQIFSSVREDVESTPCTELRAKTPVLFKLSSEDRTEVSEHFVNNDNKTVSGNTLARGGMQTKILTSGFSQFFIKNSLKGKGVVCRSTKAHDGFNVSDMDHNNEVAAGGTGVALDASHNSGSKTDKPTPCSFVASGPNTFDGIILREWLKPGSYKISRDEGLNIFRQIVELVDFSHSQGVDLQDLRPSYFKLLLSKQIKYVGSFRRRELFESFLAQDIQYPELQSSRKRPLERGIYNHDRLCSKEQKLSENMILVGQHHQLPSRSHSKYGTEKDVDTNMTGQKDYGHELGEWLGPNAEHKDRIKPSSLILSNTARQKFFYVDEQLEEKWYASPEELKESSCTFSSNIYSLGVLLFELLCCFESREAHAAAMSHVRCRILPPYFLSENPKEAGYCLWLLHPEPSSRPTTREILHSELICGPRKSSSTELARGSQELSLSKDDFSVSNDDDDAESELLLHFLTSLEEQRQKQASKLVEYIGCLEADIEEVERRHSLRASSILSLEHKDVPNAKEHRFLLKTPLISEVQSKEFPVSNVNETRWLRNITQLENAYLSMRSQLQLPESDTSVRSDNDLLSNHERWSTVQNDNYRGLKQKSADRVGAFFDGICKYARYNKFEVCGTLRNGDLLNSANVICSLSFDRDEDFVAAAGVSKKIKIFEFSSLLNDSVDIHYPVIEMASKSKLSCVCWNSYIKNYLVSTDYDGVVQLWDASTGQGFSRYTEHQRRAWSVDFSRVDPTKLASGSDDYSVKLWSINEKNCTGTIRNAANVCCVQFSAHSSHLLAFGSADYKTYCYDLRHTKIPWCTLSGHGKAVSYVKFLDPDTIVTASTDNTLKLWNLNKTSLTGLSTNACTLTYSGHTNEKNFVGLSVSDGYIACGSETNEVYAYYRSLPMPITSHKFGSIDPISGQESGDDNGQFVSSVCWRGKSNMIVAANSTGSIKLLKMV